ncbi:long-chain-fatty-acid--CoA ligase 1-like isoform X2 [Styela clava]
MAIEHMLMMSQAQVSPEQLPTHLPAINLDLLGDGNSSDTEKTNEPPLKVNPPPAEIFQVDEPGPSQEPETPKAVKAWGFEQTVEARMHLDLLPPKILKKKQSVVTDEEKGIRCSPLIKDGKLLEFMYEDSRTCHEAFLRGLRVSNNGNCLGYRPGPDQPYKWFSYQEVLDRSQRIGSGLIAKGAEAKPSQFIGIFSQNRVEWTVTEQACNCYSMVIVPLYDTLGPQAMRYIVHKCDLDIVVVDKNVKAMSLLNDAEIELKLIVLIESPTDETKQKAKERNIEVITFQELEDLGKDNKKDFVPPTPSDLHTICFTSGTTGNPKGAMLTHGAIVANTAGLSSMGADSFMKVQPSDVHLSYLPLAHMFEKVVQGLVYQDGASIGFFQGDVKLLLNDLAALKPTIFPMVPRLMNRVYDKIMAGAAQSKIKKFLLDRALKSKMKLLKQGIVTRSTFWDTLVFKKIQNMMGGRLRLCATGAAPISPVVLNFMRCALGIPFTEGYGQTEATAGISVTIPGDYEGGNVGALIPNIFAKLVDVPEKNYFAKDNKGEVCVKGTSLFSGYYKDEEKTKQAIDEDGWLHTGDVGQFLPDGQLKIFDRSKHIFKLAQGEYIAPEKIEQIYVQSAPVAQVFVHGDSLKASLVVICVPDPETVEGWCKGRGITGKYEDLCKNADAAKLILDDMNAVGKKNGLMSFELAKKIYLSTEQFTVENDLLTPTFKSRRPQLLTRYQPVIDELYVGLD